MEIFVVEEIRDFVESFDIFGSGKSGSGEYVFCVYNCERECSAEKPPGCSARS